MARQTDAIRDHGRVRRRNIGMLLLSLLMLFFICVVGALLMVDALHTDRRMAASATGLLSLIALLLWMRIVRNRWLLLRLQNTAPIASSEETGIWGVGGPGMRNPTVTGVHGPFPGRRSTDGANDSSNDPYRPG
jgi:cytochrome c biogenesis protein CcdA